MGAFFTRFDGYSVKMPYLLFKKINYPEIKKRCPPILTFLFQCGQAKRVTKIVGGVETEANEYPWQVYFHWRPKPTSTLGRCQWRSKLILPFPENFSTLRHRHQKVDVHLQISYST